MTELRREMSRLMQLKDLSVNTQKSYLRGVSGLAKHYNMSPDKISKTMVEDYLLYLKNVKKQASNGVGTVVSGLKFFYRHVLSNEENAPTYAKRSTRKLPVVLTHNEVQRIINAPKNLKHRLMLKTTYSAGLRASEVIALKPGDIESDRMLIKVENGKGKKDHYALLSKKLLKELRHYYKGFQPKTYLFPSSCKKDGPLCYESLRSAYEAARKPALTKAPGSIRCVTMPSSGLCRLNDSNTQ